MSNRVYLEAFEEEFHKTKKMTDASIAQIDDAQLHARINPRQNSVAVIMQHVAGNLQSRFTDFLASDGEKPTRDRDNEFVDRELDRPQLLQLWERGFDCLFAALAGLTDDDLDKTVLIRREPHSVLKALVRASAHCAWHTGQVALIAKHLKGEGWKYLTIPPKESAAFNKKMGV